MAQTAIAPTPHRTVPIESVQATATTEIDGVRSFRVGTWVDGWGEQRTWELAELEEAVAAYNESAAAGIRRAPVLLNHESYSGDRGWVKPTARVEGDTIVLDLEQVDLEFAADLKAGRWTYRSIGFWAPNNPYNPTPGRWNIAELSFTPLPAVDGLGTVFSSAIALKDWIKGHAPKFSAKSERESVKVAFARSPMFSAKGINSENPKFSYWGWGFDAIAQLLQAQRDQMLASSGDVEATNAAYPAEAIAAIKEMASQIFLTAEDLEMVWADMDMMRSAIAEIQNQVFQQTNTNRGYMADTNTTPETTATDHDARFSVLEAQVEALKGALETEKQERERLETANQELIDRANAADRKVEETEVRGEVTAIAREMGMDEASPEFSTFVSKHTAFALAQPKDTAQFAVGEKQVSAREFYLQELRDRKPQRPQFSAGRIEIDPSDRPSTTSDITARRKARSLPAAK